MNEEQAIEIMKNAGCTCDNFQVLMCCNHFHSVHDPSCTLSQRAKQEQEKARRVQSAHLN